MLADDLLRVGPRYWKRGTNSRSGKAEKKRVQASPGHPTQLIFLVEICKT